MGTVSSGSNTHVLKLNVVMVGQLCGHTQNHCIVLLFFFFFGCAGGLRDLRSPTRDQTLGPGCESAKSYPLAGQGIP